MKKMWMCIALTLCLLLSAVALAESYDGFSYKAYYPEYDESALNGWTATDYADTDGMLLYMHSENAELTVSLQDRSDAPTVQDLADAQLESVSSYGTITREAERRDWYAAWEQNDAGCRLSYSYTFGRTPDATVYDVVKYMAVLDDDKYVMIELVDRSGDVEAAAARLESGFLQSLTVDSFDVTGSASAYLTSADEKDGVVYLTLQTFEVVTNEDGTDYEVQVTGQPEVVELSADARVLAPADRNTGMLSDIGISGKAINEFMDGYREENGDDCVFNILFSDGKVRWMTYSYLF